MLKLERLALRTPENREHGVWEFAAAIGPDRFHIIVKDDVLGELLAVDVGAVSERRIIAGLGRIEAYVANADASARAVRATAEESRDPVSSQEARLRGVDRSYDGYARAYWFVTALSVALIAGALAGIVLLANSL